MVGSYHRHFEGRQDSGSEEKGGVTQRLCFKKNVAIVESKILKFPLQFRTVLLAFHVCQPVSDDR